MKPFNLEEALAGKPVVTKSGIPVTQISEFKVDEDSFYSVAGVIYGALSLWDKSGKYNITKDELHSFDLLMAPEKKSIWVNVWENKQGLIFTTSHNREDQADLHIETDLTHKHIKKIEIEL